MSGEHESEVIGQNLHYGLHFGWPPGLVGQAVGAGVSTKGVMTLSGVGVAGASVCLAWPGGT